MRTLSAALQTAAVQPVVPMLILVRMDFDSGTVAWNTGYRDITLNSVVYRGVGAIGSISAVRESPGLKAASITITLSGLKPEIVSLVQSEPYLNRRAWVHLAVTDEHFTYDADKVSLLFSGKLDDIKGTQGATASFDISIRSRLADWERQRKLRYTDADQQKLHPGDKGFEFVAQLSQKKIVWPRAAFLPDPRD